MRVKAAKLRGASELAEKVIENLSREHGVLESRVSSTTGSLIIRYDTHSVQLPRLIQAVLAAGGFSGVAVDAPLFGLPTMAGGDRIRAALAKLNGDVEIGTGGKVDMRTAVPGTLAGLGLLFFLFRKSTHPRVVRPSLLVVRHLREPESGAHRRAPVECSSSMSERSGCGTASPPSSNFV